MFVKVKDNNLNLALRNLNNNLRFSLINLEWQKKQFFRNKKKLKEFNKAKWTIYRKIKIYN